MDFDFDKLNEFNKDVVNSNKLGDHFFLDVVKLLVAIDMDKDNNLYVNIENKYGKCYASVHFDQNYVEGYDNINWRISLSDASIVNRLKFKTVLNEVKKYLEDSMYCIFDDTNCDVDEIFYTALSRISRKKNFLDKIGAGKDIDSYCFLTAFRNLCSIMYTYNELSGGDNLTDLNLSLISTICNYFVVNDHKNLNEIDSIKFYDKLFKQFYNILELDNFSKRKHLTNYMINENKEGYWIVNSIAKHLLVTECDYNELMSINNVMLAKTNEELAQIQFNHYYEPQTITIATAIRFTEESIKAFEEYDQIFKSCNYNRRNGKDNGELTVIFDLPELDSVLRSHKDLEEGLIFLY